MGHRGANTSASRSCFGSRLLALAGLLAPASTTAFADTPVEIPDVALTQCVEQALAKEEGSQITEDDMEGLTDLVDCDGVSNLDGIEFAKNLTQFSSSEGGIADLSPLSNLNQLRKLKLYRHPVGDLAPVAGLDLLWELELVLTDTSDLSPVTALPSLSILDVSYSTQIRRLPLWPPYTPLRNLSIAGTSVKDLSPLDTLTSLEWLSLAGLDLSFLDLNVLLRLPSLSILSLVDADSVDLTALSGLRNLTSLSLHNASLVSDLSSLANHTSLRWLGLPNTGLQSLDAIPSSVLASLQYIWLYGNLITEIRPLLSHGAELRRVDLRDNIWLSRNAVETDIPALMAKGVEVLYDLPTGRMPSTEIVGDPALRRSLIRQLTYPDVYFGRDPGYLYEQSVPADKLSGARMLRLPNEGIVSLQGLQQARSLKYLWLSGNEVSDISPIADLPLDVLALDGNPVNDFRPLVELEELLYLALDNTSLREIPALPQTWRLRHLFLAGNLISDLGPLAGGGFWFEQLWLGGNSITSLAPLQNPVEFLHLNGNEVADLAGLDLTVLEELHIANNALRDISPLLEAPALRVLDARRNPLGEDALTVAETLRARGATVHMGEAVPFLPAAGAGRTGFVRVVNRSAEGGDVFIEAWDDGGVRAGPVRLRMNGRSAVHFTSADLEDGNLAKGIAGIGAPVAGDWRLAVTSVLDVEVLSYIRTEDGFVTAMHDVAAEAQLPFFNPGSNERQRSILRTVNTEAEPAKWTTGGYDDGGRWHPMAGSLLVRPLHALTLTAQALEDAHGLGDGRGKWRLRARGFPWLTMSLLESPSGHLTNLSTAPNNATPLPEGGTLHRLPLFPAAGGSREGFARVINRSYSSGEVAIEAVDDAGVRFGPVRLTLRPRQTVHFNAADLESGNSAKGLDGGVGVGTGDWRLEVASELELTVLAYARMADGFLTSLHDLAPVAADGSHRVVFFNPGSNKRQVSKLRLINNGERAARVVIAGIDDGGKDSEAVKLSVPARRALYFTSAELEAGVERVEGGLGDGAGKWRLRVTADAPLAVMSLLESPAGHLANVSTGTAD